MAVRGASDTGSALEAMNDLWNTQIRYMGVGAMIVGGIVSIINVRHGIVKGIRSIVLGYSGSGTGIGIERTDQDMGRKMILIVGLAAIIPTFFLYSYLTASVSIAIVAGIGMIITGFFFVAVSSYMVGLIGSSNNPVSGMTISTLLLTSGLLLLFGMTGNQGIIASLGVAGVVCCAACMAGDTSQDLKTGYLVGATPWKQQLGLILGVIFPAFIIAPILTVLHTAHGIGVQVKEGVPFLRAPQANLFASISKAMFTDRSLPWTMVLIGIGIGLALLVIDSYLQKRNSPFRAYVMPVAVGIYLPMSLSTPILIGGILNLVVARSLRGRTAEEQEEGLHTGVLFSSGLIAGESITGIIIAALIFAKFDLPKMLISSAPLSLAIFAASVLALFWVAMKKRQQTE
jgi:putative OPT family oligopeptide transporter